MIYYFQEIFKFFLKVEIEHKIIYKLASKRWYKKQLMQKLK